MTRVIPFFIACVCQRRLFLDFFLPDFFAVVLAGIFMVFPARSLSLVMPLAFLISAMLTPYFFDNDDRLSPFLSLWVMGPDCLGFSL